MRAQLIVIAAFVLLFALPAAAQDDNPFTAPAQPPAKSVKDMSREERQVLWQSLSPEQKQRILERREAAQQEKMREQRWQNLKTGEAASPDDASTLSEDEKEKIARGKTAWEAMTPEQKRAFIEAHQDQIQAAHEKFQQRAMNR